MDISIFGEKQDIYYMNAAFEQAQEGYSKEEVPVGAVVVDPYGAIIAQAYNQVEQLGIQRAHAEMIALEQAALKIGNWRLLGCWLYVTLEPCSMCMGCAQLSRMAGVVYGAPSPLFGYRLDNSDSFQVYKRNALVVIGGVEMQKSEHLLKKFFHKKRTQKGG
ncbi:MAG: nucleoside deaminase [Candidatus Dependentiae bacterium]|nr:nucleoside deaminase [Candidatus Dependentiae bacterium]